MSSANKDLTIICDKPNALKKDCGDGASVVSLASLSVTGAGSIVNRLVKEGCVVNLNLQNLSGTGTFTVPAGFVPKVPQMVSAGYPGPTGSAPIIIGTNGVSSSLTGRKYVFGEYSIC